MKKLLVALLLIAAPAFAYNSGGGDPVNGAHNREYRTYKKSATAGSSLALTRGMILSYSMADADGYTLTATGGNTVVDAAMQACIADSAVATGDTRQHRCITKGFVDFAKYDASSVQIRVGDKLCADGTTGALVKCAACEVTTTPVDEENDCIHGTASGNSGVISLEQADGGTGSDLSVIVNMK